MRWFAGKVAEGFAWMLGASAARDVYAGATHEEEPPPPPPPPPPVPPEVLAREAAKKAKERAAAKKKLDKEVDAELRALKKRVRAER